MLPIAVDCDGRLVPIAGTFACDCARIFTYNSNVFLQIACILVAGKFAWVPHVKLPVKYPLYSSKFTCEMLAA